MNNIHIEENPPLCLENCQFKKELFCAFYDSTLETKYSFYTENKVTIRCDECKKDTFNHRQPEEIFNVNN